MIRSNPTAIPIRANDIKLLQAEIDKRKTAREAAQSQVQAKTNEVEGNRGKQQKGDEVFGLGEERKDRQGRSVAERIGL
ncbi:hypothetical protein L486_01238 [Kwoniella mangroviensis CBS 10435]|uniref:Uncharacterized protein n=1 Tax=Kwoniella mangroviensis CBS 10435 TaxID=1331196 RepID=A0A1B9J1C9_9TREE|nr:uncharacterized protein I203_07508 [Kwoniella mangroviensis CBS 8507]OCF61586.1 hypothetical protein L486_01238 [Kwoniella mangroviensis CBS 10435]OCF63440.1 hypothetical protein I203_07508 [Kwoniella mangroviensis CBS 8507]OCF77609.1 hypothetical protein I204_01601 [Kwoniella mangroviensis CBS 8886]